ncbi:PREDICTED: SWI/SNF complex subunit SWI3D isoform X1 [Ipomoea nil]|uniref:SWI/SNF complex subunit SWI3D isoform X1 n=1 Tax=Ipomoea nil TaxID=35883 RepID=UPI0009012BE7|nr:PREDICTED: SWI/SNF complex subunit SWI3D isoform X1 [Ipomoea nil]XP_019165865.1 PREDICTED: SWI/SNF complex subunit SWI3D isoform X1 [Ipomoea nil]
MEEKFKDSGTPPAASFSTPQKAAEAPPSDPPTSRRRGGGQKRKASALGSGGTSTPLSTSSKRQAREKPPPVPFPPIHNGPCTRARQQPSNTAPVASPSNSGVRSEADAALLARVGGAELRKAEEASIEAKEDFEALEAKIEAEFEAIRSRDANVHVVPSHAGWFSWTKVHSLEEQTMPSFFNGKSPNRTPEMYMEIRNLIMRKYHADPNTRIELKDLSELSTGVLDARQEVMEFLDYWGLINYHPFPQPDSATNVDTNVEEAPKEDSLLDKLFRFESEATWTPVVPRANMTTPALTSGLFPESTLIEELGKSEGPSVEYHCNSCSGDCSRKRYHCQKQADFDLCTECFNNGKFDRDMAPSDFILMEPAEAGGASSGKWTDQETLLLLEALELYKENWNEIAEHVATKTKAQCILHFVEMPIEDMFLDGDNKIDGILNTDVSVNDDNSASKGGPETTESKDDGNENQPASSSIEALKPDDVNDSNAEQEYGENIALKALREAFVAIDSFPSPGERLSFAEAGNPVMALATFLVKLVEANVATASVRSSLKAVSGEQLAARHCFRLEDPPDDKKSSNSDRAVTESTEPEAQQDEQQNNKLQHEEPNSVNGKIDSSVEQNNESKQAEENNEKRETMENKKQSEAGESSVKGQGEETLSHCEHSEKSESRKGTDVKVNDMVVESLHVNGRDEADLQKQETPSTGEGFDTQKSKVEPPSSSTKECEDRAIPSHSVDSPKDEDMMPATEKKEPEQSMSMVENKVKSTVGEEKDCKIEKKDASNKNDLDIDKIKHAAVTALSAAAVKAKFLAEQEEDQIRKLAASLIEKQLHKLETKLGFFSEMETTLVRVREQLDRSKQKLFHERAQIIASRFGISGSSARPMSQPLPANKPGMTFPGTAPRPLTGMGPAIRPPISRPLMASMPAPSSFMPTAVAGSSVQPSNTDKVSSVGNK